MAKRFFYAVVSGHKPGIYENWEDCQKQISGYSGAVFKKFKMKSQAEKFISSEKEVLKNNIEIEDYDLEVKKDLEDNRVVAFTDGSFCGGDNPISGYGCFILTPEGKEYEISNVVHTDKFITTNNIGPEVMAVLEALQWVVSNEYNSVTIYHDLDLIGKWADGTFQAKSEIAQLLLRELNEKYNIILDIDFKWVPSHQGIIYNEKADRLAKNSILKQNPVSKYGENFFVSGGVSKNIVDEIIYEFKNYPSIRYTLKEKNEEVERHVFEYEKEKLTVSYFEKKGKTLLQGKVRSLFSEFLSKYTLHLDDFNMIRAYSDSFKYTIRDQEINNEISNYSLPSDYPSDIITLLKQSNVFLKLDREEYDYSHYPMPAFRALEGHFKYLAAKENVIIPFYENIGNFFYYCKIDNYSKWKDNDSDLNAKKLAESSVSDKLQEIQIFLTMQRNPLSHFGSITPEGEGCANMISNLEKARDIIKGAIDLIVN